MRVRSLLLVTVGAGLFNLATWACVGDAPAPVVLNPSGDGGGSGSVSPDGSPNTVGDGGDGSQPRSCDLTKPFDPPIPVPELNTDLYDEKGPSLSADHRTIFFSRNRGSPDTDDIWTATRSSPSGPFANVRPVSELNTNFGQKYPSLSGDGLFLYFASNRPDGGTDVFDLYGAARDNEQTPFGMPSRLPFSSVYGDTAPFVLPDRTALYSSVRGEKDGGGFDGVFRIYRAALPAGPRVNAGIPPNFATSETIAPVVTPDERTIVFSSVYSTPGSKGKWDIFISQRANTSDPWGSPQIQPALNSAGNEFAHHISSDGCELWIERETPLGDGGFSSDDIFVARRPDRVP